MTQRIALLFSAGSLGQYMLSQMFTSGDLEDSLLQEFLFSDVEMGFIEFEPRLIEFLPVQTTEALLALEREVPTQHYRDLEYPRGHRRGQILRVASRRM